MLPDRAVFFQKLYRSRDVVPLLRRMATDSADGQTMASGMQRSDG